MADEMMAGEQQEDAALQQIMQLCQSGDPAALQQIAQIVQQLMAHNQQEEGGMQEGGEQPEPSTAEKVMNRIKDNRAKAGEKGE